MSKEDEQSKPQMQEQTGAKVVLFDPSEYDKFEACRKLRLSERDRIHIADMIKRWIASKRFIKYVHDIEPKEGMIDAVAEYINNDGDTDYVACLWDEGDKVLVSGVIFELSD